ncbi:MULTISPECIES: cupin domain-containing protein [Actinosynnema]|uniref:cupin domain-containing protein n=1 Tax=Actinosynnema TaxID=40566 RepID=UPI0020A5B929|nr:cupin domain-containing protein [Actinosynnema pretiosum]MCP2096549.1 Cupin domain-containing protein [Actinosynnema pretiosum]
MSFPGGASLSWLDVYPDVAPDGLGGGSPHVHLVSTECYTVVAGEGELHTAGPGGVEVAPLRAGVVVWFEPGVIHRAVNLGGLRVVVIMSNAGLPEAGDAVMTFPPDVLADPERYREAAVLPQRGRAEAAARRRDLAVEGFLPIRDALRAGDSGPLRDFHAAAAALVRDRAVGWGEVVRDGPLRLAEQARGRARDLSAGTASHLERATVRRARGPQEPVFGMCGLLRPIDTRNEPREEQP